MAEIKQDIVGIISQESFCLLVEAAVNDKNIGYLEALVEVCTATGIEFESVDKLITPVIKSKLFCEASSINMIKKTSSKLSI